MVFYTFIILFLPKKSKNSLLNSFERENNANKAYNDKNKKKIRFTVYIFNIFAHRGGAFYSFYRF